MVDVGEHGVWLHEGSQPCQTDRKDAAGFFAPDLDAYSGEAFTAAVVCFNEPKICLKAFLDLCFSYDFEGLAHFLPLGVLGRPSVVWLPSYRVNKRISDTAIS